MTCFCAGNGAVGVGSGWPALVSGTICFCPGTGDAVGVGSGCPPLVSGTICF
jgi:hypothetical protein